MKTLTEDQVRSKAEKLLQLDETNTSAIEGVGQITTFNQLNFVGISDKPDGWILPKIKNDPALILETKAEKFTLTQKHRDELLKNCKIISSKYSKIIGILYNGKDIIVYKRDKSGNFSEVPLSNKLESKEYYLNLKKNLKNLNLKYFY